MTIGDLTGNEHDVCIVWDRNGAYEDTFANSDEGIRCAKHIHGSYLIVRPTQITERVKQAQRYEDSAESFSSVDFTHIFRKFFPIFRGDHG
ncbi:hypothetical protein EVB87_063 [Rhizobium phage RHph_N28_1]|nr:hypothetical protein EVB87_063 [Rhizobium phage RHph_N28_1]QIG74091.1 hypothetical protein EVC07_063 [Rhizobium phage RHph_N42]QIG74697.1 hypothetical protein EVC12_062 [Rhizobium phage RHph_I42]